MVFYKITNNNMVVDIFKEQPRYIRYLTNSKRAIAVQKNAANGVMGSDKNTIYHLEGTINNFPDEKEWEKIVEDAFSSDEEHIFSEHYKLQKQQMLRRITMTKKTFNKNKIKYFIHFN